jgi:hypothetical protein
VPRSYFGSVVAAYSRALPPLSYAINMWSFLECFDLNRWSVPPDDQPRSRGAGCDARAALPV